MVQFVSPTPRRQAGAVRSYIEANDTLHVWMGLNEAGKSYPSKALARGKVSALQQGSKIAADEVTVTFQPAAGDEAETETAPAASEVLAGMGGKVDPITFHASGAVDIKYVETKRPDEPPLCVQADLVDADLASELAVLMGAPAKIWRGTDRIEGEVIHFDRNAEAAKVTGKGSLRFYTKQDLSGNTLSTPRPVRVAWSNWMLYHGQAGQCVFDGEVDLASAGEKMHCPKQMRLFFEPRKRDESGSTQQGIPRGARSLAMGVDDFSGARFSRIEADGGSDESQWVRMQTQRAHPQNDTWVLQRMQVRGRQVLYDDTEGFAYVNGPGDFLAEDYRLPRETDRRRREEYANVMGGQIDRPSQTLFRWKQAMYLDQNNRNVSLREGVEMIHRSGNKMISLPNLNTQPFGRLEDGRISTLRSELLDAWFEPPAAEVPVRDESGRIKDTKRRPSVDLLQGGPEFGELRKFSATGDVSMKMADDGFGYGTTLIDGQRVLYDGIRQIINVWGYREGASKRMDAQITIEDRRAGVPPKTVNSPMLIYDLKNDVIKVETVRGGGGM